MNSLDSGLVGWWTFNNQDIVRGVLQDKSGSGNNGNFKNIASSTFYRAGKLGQAGNFDGVDDIASSSPATSLNIAGDLTLSAWVKPATGPNSRPGIICEQGSYNNAYCLFLNSNGALAFSVNPDGTNHYTTSAGSFRYNEWTHIVGKWDGTNMSIYKNGIRVYFGVGITESYTRVFGGIRIGQAPGSAAGANVYYKGLIDDVRIYNRALSPTEVKQLYLQGQVALQSTVPAGRAH